MKNRILLASFLTVAALFATAPRATAQDSVTLHSVTVHVDNTATVVYSKNFATCAHMRFSNATCTQLGALTHVANWFCTLGNNVSLNLPLSAFVAGFGPNVPVLMVHGNNSGVASPCVDVVCDGVYGTGCAGTHGVPVLATPNACPPAGSNLDLAASNGPHGSLAVFGFGFGQASVPLFGCNLLVASLQSTLFVLLDGAGATSLTMPLPPGVTGVMFHAQLFAIDAGGPQGFSATNGVEVHVH